MSADDKKWLQEAMTQYTFDDTNKMKDIVKKLDEDLKSGFTKISKEGSDYSETADLVDQL
jgi:Zn-dependent M16 (insulinase) family peptidase